MAVKLSDSIKESAIQKQILAYLQLKGILAERRNVGAARFGKSYVRFASPGAADIWGVLPNGRHFEIEIKTRNGRLSLAQMAWRDVMKRNNVIYVLAYCLEDVQEALEN